MSNEKILIVDDEQDILDLLAYNLKREEFRVFTASNGKEALEIAIREKPELILLDVMMPEMDGMETCAKIRENQVLKHCIVAMLTARGEDYSQIAGFDAGADDYITKPIKPRVLISRIKALLRRGVSEVADAPLGVSINKDKYVAIKDGKEISLPKKEFELLALLISQPEKVFTRESILSLVWGDDVVVGDRTIDVHIRKLREKLGNEHFKTVKGVGYKFEA